MRMPVDEVLGLLGMLEQICRRDHALVQSPQELERPDPVAIPAEHENLLEVFGHVPTE
jgi:hypothetical protein